MPSKKLLLSFVGKRLRKFDIVEYFSKFGSVTVELGADGEVWFEKFFGSLITCINCCDFLCSSLSQNFEVNGTFFN